MRDHIRLSTSQDSHTHDLVGIGFGPSNLALAVALEEIQSTTAARVDARFVDAKPEFSWHPGMLLDEAMAQVPFLKDVATMRNPRSRYTYLNWLHERDLLFEFINLRDVTPSRRELNAYFCWVADHFSAQVDYGARATSIDPVLDGDRVVALDVSIAYPGGARESRRTRTVVVSTGGTPLVPEIVRPVLGDRVFHSIELLPRLAAALDACETAERRVRVLVVGAGQSAGDTVNHLLSEHPGVEVVHAFRGFAPRPLDESPYVNELFGPSVPDLLYDLPEDERRRLLARHHVANYSAIDASLLTQIYRADLRSRILGDRRLTLRRFSDLTDVRREGDGYAVEFVDVVTGRSDHVAADIVVLCTGFSRDPDPALLKALRPWLRTSEDGRYAVNRDYAVRADPNFRPQVYLQGFSERTHGLSDTLLSLVAVRSGEIAESVHANIRDVREQRRISAA